MSEQGRTAVLLGRWHDGDDAALHVLLEEELPWIREHMNKRIGPLLRQLGDTEDYVQNAMVRVLRTHPRFTISDRKAFRGLLAVLIENMLRDEHEFHRRECRDPARQRSLPHDSVLDLDPPRRSVTRPSAVAQRDEEADWLHLAIQLLPAIDRQVVQLRTWEGLTFGEVGEVIDAKENTVRMRFQRALAKVGQNFVQLRAGRLGAVLARRDETAR